jgi:hypothetical protein
MTIKYAPITHTLPVTAQVDSVTIAGMAPGQVITALADPHGAPPIVWLPTAITSDGFPGSMRPFTTATVGTVS